MLQQSARMQGIRQQAVCSGSKAGEVTRVDDADVGANSPVLPELFDKPARCMAAKAAGVADPGRAAVQRCISWETYCQQLAAARRSHSPLPIWTYAAGRKRRDESSGTNTESANWSKTPEPTGCTGNPGIRNGATMHGRWSDSADVFWRQTCSAPMFRVWRDFVFVPCKRIKQNTDMPVRING